MAISSLRLCECGCGEPAPITDQKRGEVLAGQPLRFVHGHNTRGRSSHFWKGGRVCRRGYVGVLSRDHPRGSGSHPYVLEHVLVAERVLGRYLPEGSVVHHVNGDPSDNRPANLVICENNGYHNILHRRIRAKRACGHAGWLFCMYCKEYDAPENLWIHPRRASVAAHQSCWRKARRAHRARTTPEIRESIAERAS